MSESPIEQYLDELYSASRALAPREARILLAEVEAHLRDSVDADVASGVSVLDAEHQAIARFGSSADLVARERARQRTPVRVILGQGVRTGVFLGAIGAIAVGVSGVVAGVIYLFGGPGSIARTPSVSDLVPSNCARWLALGHASSCRSAAMSDWANETIYYRIALGLLGVVALLASRGLAGRGTLSPLVTTTIAATLFGAAGLATLALGVDVLVVSSGQGAGQWLSAAPVALVAAGFYASRLIRMLQLTAPAQAQS